MKALLSAFLLLCMSTIALSAPSGVVVAPAPQWVPSNLLDVSWHATGSPGFVTVDGKGGKADCKVAGSGPGTVCLVALDAFTTGIALRDKHMREKYLETAKWPKAVLKVTAAGVGAFAGELTLKGKTKPVNGKYTLHSDGLLEAEFTISLDDYGVGVPSYLGVTVAKDVAVTVAGKVQ